MLNICIYYRNLSHKQSTFAAVNIQHSKKIFDTNLNAYQEESLEPVLARIAASEVAEATTRPAKTVVNDLATRYVPDTESLEETLARIAALEQPATRDVLSFSGGHSVVNQSGGGLLNSAGQDIDLETAAILQARYGDNWRRPQF